MKNQKKRRNNLNGALMADTWEEQLNETTNLLHTAEFAEAKSMLRRLHLYVGSSSRVVKNEALIASLEEKALIAEAFDVLTDRDFFALLDYPEQVVEGDATLKTNRPTKKQLAEKNEFVQKKDRLVELLLQLHNRAQTSKFEPEAPAKVYELALTLLALPGRIENATTGDFERMLSVLSEVEPAYNYVYLALSRLLLTIADNYLPAGHHAMVEKVALWCLQVEKARCRFQPFGMPGVYKATELFVKVAIEQNRFDEANRYVDQLLESCKHQTDGKHWAFQAEKLKGECQLAHMMQLDAEHQELHNKLQLQ